MAAALTVRDVHKSFTLPQEQVHTLKERALHPFRRPGSTRLQAVDGVTFDVEEGEFFGIVGRNGSGKSTLLKCLAGIYETDSGEMWLRGRLSTFIELGVGFNPDLAARDNAILNSIMLGLTRKEAEERYQSILDFSELREFEDLKIKNYSSGMLVRLAFATMIQVDADVLLIDEVLAVGDASFQQKCYEEFDRLREEGRTILFVTHDMGAVTRFCDRAVLLERGRQTVLGTPQEVSRRYFELNFGHDEMPAPIASPDPIESPRHYGDGRAEVADAWFEDGLGNRVQRLEQGRPAAFVGVIRFEADLEDPVFGLTMLTTDGLPAFATSSQMHEGATGSFKKGDLVGFRVAFDNYFTPGRYFATPWLTPAGGGDPYVKVERMAPVAVVGGRPGDGVVDLPHQVRVERPDAGTVA